MAKPEVVQWVEDNYPQLECGLYSTVFSSAIGAVAVSAYNGFVPGVLGAGAIAIAAQYTAELAGCNKPPDIPDVNPFSVGNCWKGTSDGNLEYFVAKGGFWKTVLVGTATEVLEVVQGEYNPGFKAWSFTGRVSTGNGTGEYQMNFADGGNPVQVRITGRPCSDEPVPPPHTPGEPIGPSFEPVTTDQCVWKCTPIDAYIDASGLVRYYVLCSASNPAACGGPYGYWTGGSEPGPDWVNPVPPVVYDPDGNPITPEPFPPGDQPNFKEEDPRAIDGTTYRLNSVCEVDANGQPVQQSVVESIPTSSAFDAIIARLDAIVPLLQGQKDFKQPICPPVKAAGEFRTIAFVSDEVSPNGKSALRKRLRYRSVSGFGLDQLIDHWRDFEFNAGPVIVKHRGSSWGTVTVWAASADEGKRVIRHAAGEAGIDADQTGRWEISGSSSTRLGMPGKMKINTSGGYYWITARDGSDNRPLVGTT